MEPWLRQIVRCPVCRAELRDVADSAGASALECTGRCSGDEGVFPIRDGIPVLLPPEIAGA